MTLVAFVPLFADFPSLSRQRRLCHLHTAERAGNSIDHTVPQSLKLDMGERFRQGWEVGEEPVLSGVRDTR